MRSEWTKIYQEYAEGTPISTLAKKHNVTEAELRKKFKEYR